MQYRHLGALIVVAAFISVGCLNPAYTIHHDELVRLAQTPPEQRGARVRVTQQLATDDSPPAASSSPPATQIAVGAVFVGSAPHYSRPSRDRHSRRRTRSSGDDDDSAGVAMLVVGAGVGLGLAVTEGARFDGWMGLSPGYPIHLFGRDGSYAWMPLEALDMQFADWAEEAVILEGEGTMHFLERAPLNRVGFAFDFELGMATFPDAEDDADLGFGGRIGLGVFPTQRFGLVFALGITFTDSRPEWRPMVELQAFPLQLGILHAGPYVEGGYSFADEDERTGRSLSGWTFGGGGLLQLDVTTRFAFTLRAGISALTLEDDLLVGPEMLVGFAVY